MFILISLLLICLILLISYIVYRMVFYVPRKKTLDPRAKFHGKQYEKLASKSLELIDYVCEFKYEEISIKSKDGLLLYGKYYESSPNAPLQIMFHGYQSVALRDMAGGLKIALNNGYNALLVDQRAHGKSEGKYLSMGIKEREDCMEWVNYAIKRFGKDVQIVLVGASMGAATVLMSSDMDMPANVKGIIADSGYSAVDEIIKKVMKDRHYPVWPSYFLLTLWTKYFAHLDLECPSAKNSLSKTNIPVLFIHGDADHFVPYYMSQKLYELCSSKKEFLTIKDAGHCLGYLVDTDSYTKKVISFLNEIID